ncbi:MAG: META domain-containing protein [Lentisphaeria bacterium]|nr:META domain-containing protein [Lentisphaeria bacterium]
MQLDPVPQPKIQEIVEKHQQNVNRVEELNILCGKAWVPVYIKGQEGVDGKNAISLPPEVQAYVEFQRDGKITGFAGVNVFNGSFAVTAPNHLRFGALVSNLQAGPHLDYEMLFMAQLNDVDRFVMNKTERSSL